MRKITFFLSLAAFAALPVLVTSCDDDDPWHRPGDDPFGWMDDYENYRWNNNYNNEYDSQDNERLLEAQALCGEWYGPMDYSYLDDSGTRQTSSFYADMVFYQYNESESSLSGGGVEIDYVYDESGNVSDSQTLKFSWYVDESNGDIYIKYTGSGSIFVLDAGASQYGFRLGETTGDGKETFWGYMIGTNTDDLIQFDFTRQTSSEAKGMLGVETKAVAQTAIFGTGTSKDKLQKGSQKLMRR